MKEAFSKEYGNLEHEHWWFRARRVILRGLLARHLKWTEGTRVLEIGVGPGENLYTLYPDTAAITGVEPDPANAAKADARGPIRVYCGTVENLPPEVANTSYDVVCLFDVLEHIQDDEGGLRIIRRLLKPGGAIVLSVPCYRWMWGLQDVVSLHYRRYTRSELVRKLQSAGLVVERATYFNTLLFPLIALFRLLAKLSKQERKAGSDFDVSSRLIDRVMYTLFRAEWPVLAYMNFPFGVSCFALARLEAPKASCDSPAL
ncbi:MAG TPA: class I SAM-dependent methyltransferase [Kiritimatiellia bacterium]|nr:class I SAM-dependent methyltransferase [Kiritimatiellia bacterium]HMO98684.1 class I SAM-dependent methyltransferase [Kiritimatiellia bacterium]